MSSLLLSLPELFNSYKNWVSKNPQSASEYELTAKWVSYFIAGRIHNSHIVSELVYCLSNLLVLFNDGIIRKSISLKVANTAEQIKLWLTVVEYSEVFCELSVQKIWGRSGKWLLIVAIQVFKCVARFLLIYKYKEDVIENPPIPPLERKTIQEENSNCKSSTGLNTIDVNSVSFTLKRSGRTIRKVESSPPLRLRNWKPVELEVPTPSLSNLETKELNEEAVRKKQILAESIYISKPIIHLISMGVFGSRAWKPWMISLAMDLTSLQLYKSTVKPVTLTRKQKLQLSKRTVLLLLYLIRSPFYEKHSKDKINAFLTALSNNVPLVKIICQPLMQYLPFWQGNYFYMWST